ncbi:MAG: N-acetylmuramoyl-L-alanine amidase [Caldilineaceae bacterium]
MRHHTLQSIQRYLVIISFLSLIGIGAVSLRIAGYDFAIVQTWLPPGLLGALFNRQIALISGHAGNDSGAVCTDAAGNVTVTEAEITAAITARVAQQLRRVGAHVLVLEEFDSRLDDLTVDLLVSLHADSCIEASGYKFAQTASGEIDSTVRTALGACFDQSYAAITSLAPHPNTITHNMTDYHAFRRIHPRSPALILEMGFIGGDQQLFVQHPDLIARGITTSIRCFFQTVP